MCVLMELATPLGGVPDAQLAADDGVPPDLSEVLSLSGTLTGSEELRCRPALRSSPSSACGGTTQTPPSRDRLPPQLLVLPPESPRASDNDGIVIERTLPPAMPPATARLLAEAIGATGAGGGGLGGSWSAQVSRPCTKRS